MKIPKLNELRETVIRHADWEMVLMRLFMLWPFWIVTTRSVVNVQPKPNGLAHFLDFTWLANPSVPSMLTGLFAVCGVLYVSGYLMIPALGVLTAILVAKGTLINSQGAINHALQLLTLVALTQFIIYCLRFRFHWTKQESHIQAMHWSKITIAASYVSAAVCKLFASSEFWIARAPYMALQVIKSNMQAYYNDLVVTTSPIAEKFPYWVVDHPNLARVFFTAGLLLELFAFLSLVNRWWALFIGVSMLLLHWSVQILMNLEFKHHVYLLLIFYVNAPWLIYAAQRKAFIQTATIFGALTGCGIGFVMSYWIQPGSIRMYLSLDDYVLRMLEEWNRTVNVSCVIGLLVGGLAAYILAKKFYKPQPAI